MKKSLVILLLMLVWNFVFACQCPLTKLDKNEIAKYEIVFKGSIKSIKLNKSKSEAIFSISELYKGIIAQEFKILFNDEDQCKLDLRVGEQWIIYTNYYQVDNAKLDFCSRSRKYIKNVKEDFYAETTGITFDDELRYLQTNLGLHKVLKNDLNKVENRNVLPNTNQLIIYLVLSIIGVVFFYYILNQLFKKYS
jgi:hypothetical protein